MLLSFSNRTYSYPFSSPTHPFFHPKVMFIHFIFRIISIFDLLCHLDKMNDHVIKYFFYFFSHKISIVVEFFVMKAVTTCTSISIYFMEMKWAVPFRYFVKHTKYTSYKSMIFFTALNSVNQIRLLIDDDCKLISLLASCLLFPAKDLKGKEFQTDYTTMHLSHFLILVSFQDFNPLFSFILLHVVLSYRFFILFHFVKNVLMHLESLILLSLSLCFCL